MNLRRLARKVRDAKQARRLMALAESLKDVASEKVVEIWFQE